MGTETRWAEYDRLASELGRLTDEMADLRVTARSTDRCVEATVGPTGELSAVSIDPAIAARLDLPAIGRRVVEAAALAAAEARALRVEAVGRLLPAHLLAVVGAASEGGRS